MVSEKDFPVLLFIAKKAGLNDSVKTSTTQIALDLNISQQSVSRKLSFLAEKNLIERKVFADGNILSLTEKGIELLKKRKNELNEIFSSKKKRKKLSGTVLSGLGEGKYYIDLSGYQKQFKEKLGKKVFAGTLNLKVKESELNEFLSSKEKILISGFSTEKRSFGPALLFKVKINDLVSGSIIVPERTNHPLDIAEVISEFNLRKKLKLKDNNIVYLT
ncbi:MAG: riboflavin kinase [Candidatus Diapherotrites archaeon CG10_big_fil_rev_8_21_14_0_10_31_34]|nr:MAG: riboflavin kinase [Candidatus Diapherotrites archaeon CG10_big_fil_rev_8_21_14_0_10_31_34]